MRLRRELVLGLQKRGFVRNARVRDAFLSVPRELFLPTFAERNGIDAVYRDEPVLTKRNALGFPLSSSSQPAIMAQMLEQLQVEEGMSVLEIGAGTGYNAALLSRLVGPRGRIVSIDIDSDLVRSARRSLRAGGYRVRVLAGDGRNGYAETARYDRIIVTASSDSVPLAWFEQLRLDGRLEVPLRLSTPGTQPIPVLAKDRGGFRSTCVVAGGFMPLRAAGEDAAESLKLPTLRASDGTGDTSIPLQQISGEALRTLSARARRQLLSIALSQPRRRPLGVRASSRALALFLSLRIPTRHLVAFTPGFDIGVISRDGESLAVIEPSFQRTDSTTNHFLRFGTAAAERLLLEHVRDWQRRGRPRPDDLEITVSYDGGRSRIRTRWPA